MHTFASSPAETKNVSALNMWLPAKVVPLTNLSCALIWKRGFYLGRSQKIISPSALPDSISVILERLFAKHVTPSE